MKIVIEKFIFTYRKCDCKFKYKLYTYSYFSNLHVIFINFGQTSHDTSSSMVIFSFFSLNTFFSLRFLELGSSRWRVRICENSLLTYPEECL